MNKGVKIINKLKTNKTNNKQKIVWPENLYLVVIKEEDYKGVPENAKYLINCAFKQLTREEISIICLKFIEELTIEDISKNCGISCERAQQVESDAINKLKNPEIIKILQNYECM